MGQGKQFIQKASRPVRWHTDVLKHHLNLILSFFYIRGDGDGARGSWGQEVMISLRHLDVSRDLSRVLRLLVLDWLTPAISLTWPWCSRKSLTTQLSLLYILLYLFWGRDFQEVIVSILSHEQNSVWWLTSLCAGLQAGAGASFWPKN